VQQRADFGAIQGLNRATLDARKLRKINDTLFLAFWLRIRRLGVRISSGAPLAYKTANICAVPRPAHGCCGENGFVTQHPDFAVPYLDLGDDGPQVRLARLNVGGIEFLAHQLLECFKANGCYFRPRTTLNSDPVERGLRCPALVLQSPDSFLEIVVEIDNAFLDGPIEPLQPIVVAGDLGLQGAPTLLDSLVFCAFALDQSFKDAGKPIAAEQMLFHILDHEPVQLGHWHVTTPTDRPALLVAAAAVGRRAYGYAKAASARLKADKAASATLKRRFLVSCRCQTLLLGEERFDRRSSFDWSRHHEQVAVVDQFKAGIWNEPSQNAAVDGRHQGIIPSHEH
jgi:hypothetical protein